MPSPVKQDNKNTCVLYTCCHRYNRRITRRKLYFLRSRPQLRLYNIILLSHMLRSTLQDNMIHSHGPTTVAQMGQTINPLTVSYCSLSGSNETNKARKFPCQPRRSCAPTLPGGTARLRGHQLH